MTDINQQISILCVLKYVDFFFREYYYSTFYLFLVTNIKKNKHI